MSTSMSETVRQLVSSTVFGFTDWRIGFGLWFRYGQRRS